MRLVSIHTNPRRNLYFWANLLIGRGIIAFINRCRNNGVESYGVGIECPVEFRAT